MVIINGVNILRKINALVSGISFIASLAFFLIANLMGSMELVIYSAILTVIALYLTLSNINVNNIIGTTFGFILSYLGVNFFMKGPALVITTILCLAMPIFNLLYIAYKRIARGTIISVRDAEHVFLKMQQKGMKIMIL